MLRSTLVGLTLALSISGPALAQTVQPQGQQPTSQAPSVQDKVVCKIDRDIGSIMPRRTCHKQSEWRAIEAASAVSRQRALDDQDNHQMMQDMPH